MLVPLLTVLRNETSSCSEPPSASAILLGNATTAAPNQYFYSIVRSIFEYLFIRPGNSNRSLSLGKKRINT